MPRVSAIITTFNRADLLKEAVASVLAQTYPDFELGILDNASTDETESVVRSFTDPRIRYIRHEPVGISEARNLGVREARGEFVAFLDDDDVWLPKKLELQLARFDAGDSSLALVYGGFLRSTREGKIVDSFTPRLRGRVLERYLCDRDPLTGSASNPLIRKSALLDVGGYNPAFLTSEDWELYLRLAEKYAFDFVAEPVVKIRTHTGHRLGDRLRDALRVEEAVLERYRNIFDRRRDAKSFYLQAIGGKYCRLGEMKKGRVCLSRALSTRPTNLIAVLQYVLSFLGPKPYARAHKWYKKHR